MGKHHRRAVRKSGRRELCSVPFRTHPKGSDGLYRVVHRQVGLKLRTEEVQQEVSGSQDSLFFSPLLQSGYQKGFVLAGAADLVAEHPQSSPAGGPALLGTRARTAVKVAAAPGAMPALLPPLLLYGPVVQETASRPKLFWGV